MTSSEFAKEAPPASGDKFEVAAADLVSIVDETKPPSNPVSRFFLWVLSFTIPGLGMFSEAYFVFAVGIVSPLWSAMYPDCFGSKPTACNSSLSKALAYTQVCGIILGQLTLGFLADKIGRKYGSVITASIMLIFAILMGASYGTTTSGLFTMFAIMQFFFGVGVGGEYPVASTSANERAEATRTLHERRGETVISVFSMQGWGNLMNTLVLAILLAVTGQVNGSKVGPGLLEWNILAIVWRTTFFVGCFPLMFIVCWRIFVLKESAVWIGKRKALQDLGNVDNSAVRRKYGMYLYHYWHRSFATAMAWFVWDFAFYGNKLFQGVFIKIINPSAGLYEATWWTFLNNFVALIGYYFAAFTVDKTWMGRRTMQAMGFTWMFLLFGASAIWFNQLQQPANIHAFQFLYYFSSFWGQFGPNATTWLLPAELTPTEMRSLGHGFSAAVGKAGALVAGVVFGLVNNQDKFIISAVCGITGAILTILMIGDLTGLDLKEGDKRWLAILDNRPYTGEAVNPKHLSLFERMIGYGRLYNSSASGEGAYHTQAAQVAGLVVGTKTEAGAGPDTTYEPHGAPGKDASFQAKSLQYM